MNDNNPAGWIQPALQKEDYQSNKLLPRHQILKLLARPLIVCLVLVGSHLLISRQAFAARALTGRGILFS